MKLYGFGLHKDLWFSLPRKAFYDRFYDTFCMKFVDAIIYPNADVEVMEFGTSKKVKKIIQKE